jgi:hypothetical protein
MRLTDPNSAYFRAFLRVTICFSSCHGCTHDPVALPLISPVRAPAPGRRAWPVAREGLALHCPHLLTRKSLHEWLTRAPFSHGGVGALRAPGGKR